MKKPNLPANFLISLNSGGLEINCDNQPAIKFTATKDSRIIDILDMPVKLSKKPGFFKQLSQAKTMAKKLKEEKITLDVRYKGDLVLRLGEKANPKLARIVTLSKDIEITDLKKMKEIGTI